MSYDYAAQLKGSIAGAKFMAKANQEIKDLSVLTEQLGQEEALKIFTGVEQDNEKVKEQMAEYAKKFQEVAALKGQKNV